MGYEISICAHILVPGRIVTLDWSKYQNVAFLDPRLICFYSNYVVHRHVRHKQVVR